MRTLVAAAVCATLVANASATQPPGPPTLAALLDRAATALAAYEQQAAAMAIEEQYSQTAREPGRAQRRRESRSDLLLLSAGAMGWVGFRDTFEIDGHAVRDRDDRLAALLLKPAADVLAQATRVAEASAHVNIGPVQRTLNVPLMSLVFLRRDQQSRSTFSIDGQRTLDGVRVTGLRFQEQARPRMLVTRDEAAARGRFWVDPATGRVHESEFLLQSSGYDISLTVRFGTSRGSTLWMPLTMNEAYRPSTTLAAGSGNRAGAAGTSGDAAPLIARGSLEAYARYSKPRQFNVNVEAIIK